VFSLKGLELTFSEIMSICDTFTLEAPVIHILYTKFDKRVKISRDTFQQLADTYRDYLIPVPIRTSSEYAKALANHTTVFASSRRSIAKEDYDNYVRYLLGIDSIGTL
jgi:cellulose biosynthesis protein BcsQ